MRKFTFFAFIGIFASFISIAQITKGSLLLGGSVGLTKQNSESSTGTVKNTSWNFSPMVGLAVKANTIAGVTLSYAESTTSYFDTRQHGYGAGTFLRRYKTLGKGFYLFGEANLLYNYSKYEQTAQSVTFRLQKQNGVSLNLFPGISYAAGKRFYLETTLTNLFSVSYSHTQIQNRNGASSPLTEENQKNFGLGFGAGGNIPVNLGFRFIFSGK